MKQKSSPELLWKDWTEKYPYILKRWSVYNFNLILNPAEKLKQKYGAYFKEVLQINSTQTQSPYVGVYLHHLSPQTLVF
jgi:hypothetical protein